MVFRHTGYDWVVMDIKSELVIEFGGVMGRLMAQIPMRNVIGSVSG